MSTCKKRWVVGFEEFAEQLRVVFALLGENFNKRRLALHQEIQFQSFPAVRRRLKLEAVADGVEAAVGIEPAANRLG